jgi:hypothetical protein
MIRASSSPAGRMGLYSQKMSCAAPIELATSLRFHELAWRGDALQ